MNEQPFILDFDSNQRADTLADMENYDERD